MSEQPPTEYAPPGWFPDPAGLQAQRWWDGTQWGQQTRPLPGNEQEPQLPYQQQQSYGQPRQPSFTPAPHFGTPSGQPPYQGHPQYRGTPHEQPYVHAQPSGQQPGPPPGKPARKSWPQRHKVLSVLGCLAALIIVIAGIANANGKAKQADNASAVATTTPTHTATSSRAPTHHATSVGTVPTKAPVTVQANAPAPAATTPAPVATTRAPAATTPVSTAAKPTATAHAAAPPPPTATAPAGCHPLTNGGNCYEPGEYCRDSDHGTSGVAGDGEAITCEDNDGWRWEPS